MPLITRLRQGTHPNKEAHKQTKKNIIDLQLFIFCLFFLERRVSCKALTCSDEARWARGPDSFYWAVRAQGACGSLGTPRAHRCCRPLFIMYMHTYTHTNECIYVYVYIYIYMYMYISYVCVCVCVYANICICIDIYVHKNCIHKVAERVGLRVGIKL
jgi:hypothetical protein